MNQIPKLAPFRLGMLCCRSRASTRCWVQPLRYGANHRQIAASSCNVVESKAPPTPLDVQVFPSRGIIIPNNNFHVLHRNYATSSTEESSPPFPHEYYQPYKRAVANIFSSTEFKSKKKSLMGQQLWSEDMFQQFEQWLLLKKPVVDTTKCWGNLREGWMAELTSNSTSNDAEEPVRKNAKQSLYHKSELATQSEALQSKIFASPDPKNDCEERALLVSKAVARMKQFVFHKLIDYRQGGGKSKLFIMPIVWYKMKENGVILQPSKLRLLLNTMIESVIKADHWEQSTSLEMLFEELIMYHDLISGEMSENFGYQRYPAMLRYHCERGDADAALSLLRQIQPCQSAPFKFDHYLLVLATLVKNGHFRDSGVELFDEIASDMSDQAYKITKSSALQLHNALAKGSDNLYTNNSESSVISNLAEWNESEDVPVRDIPAKSNELLACRAVIDPFTGVCNVTNTQLRNKSLTQPEKRRMFQDILVLGENEELAGKKRMKVSAVKELRKFADWMDNRTGNPFTFIIDGANVGALESMVERLQKTGEHPLVLLPERAREMRAKAVACGLKNRGNLYIVPWPLDDDLFCMLATVSEQKSSGSGVCPILITNDQFFDHRAEMRDQSLFQDWYARQCYKHGQSSGEMKRIPTNVYNRRIRSNDWSDNDEEDASSSWGGKVWHFPVNGWGFQERFVMRIPVPDKQSKDDLSRENRAT